MRFWQRTRLVILAVGIALVVGMLDHAVRDYSTSNASTVVLLTFANVNQGEYPNGDALDPDDIVSLPVLERVVKAQRLSDLGLTAGKLRGLLEVQSYVSPQALDKAEQLRREGKPAPATHPNQFRVSFRYGDEFGLDIETQKRTLQGVVDAYREVYRLRAGFDELERSRLMPEDELLTHDYVFVPAILDNQLQLIRDHTDSLRDKAKTFRSPSLGLTFSDVLQGMDTLRNNGVAKVRSIIEVSHLVKDRDQAIRRYQTQIENLQRQQMTDMERARFARDLLSELDKPKADQKAPESGASNLVQVLVQQEYRKSLLQQALDRGVAAQNTGVDISSHRAEIAALNESTPAALAPPALVGQLEEQIKDVLHQLDRYVAAVATMRQEYLSEDADRAVVVVQDPAPVNLRRSQVTVAQVYGFSGLLVGLILAALQPLWTNRDWLGMLKKRAQASKN